MMSEPGSCGDEILASRSPPPIFHRPLPPARLFIGYSRHVCRFLVRQAVADSAGFAVVYLKEPLTWNYAVGFALIAAGAFFVFHKW
jgi:hypothetical protein